MTRNQRLVAVIGDVVGSRGVPDRPALQKQLERTLVHTNKVTSPLQPLRMTLGDQFQGVFPRLSDALDQARTPRRRRGEVRHRNR